MKEILQKLREELISQGFDASAMTDDELLAWCERAGIEVTTSQVN